MKDLIESLARSGWKPWGVDDGGDQLLRATNKDEAMEAIFAVDDAWLYFRHADHPKTHGVWLIGGNGEDIISDWTYDMRDPDGFHSAMEAATKDA